MFRSNFSCLALILVVFITLFQSPAVAQDTSNSPAIKCFVSEPPASISLTRVLSKLFPGTVEQINGSSTIYSHESSSSNYIVSTSSTDDSSYADISLLFVESTSLFNEEKLLTNIQSCLKTLLRSESKKSIAIYLQSDSKAAQQRVLFLLKEAYYLLDDKESYREKDLLSELDIKILSLKSFDVEKMDPLVIKSFQTMVKEALKLTKRTVENILSPTSEALIPTDDKIKRTSTSSSRSASPISVPSKLYGYEESHAAVDNAVEWARNKTSESIMKLQKVESAADFPYYVDNLVNGAISLYYDKIEGYTISKHINILAQQEIKRRILTFMQPFFRVQTQLARRVVVDEFSTIMNDEDGTLLNDIHLDSKLPSITNRLLSNYTQAIRKLTPKCAYNTINWNGDLEKKNLQDYFDAYLEEIIAQGRLRGVLSRGRKPIAISFHTIMYHPLRRDYRQDVIGDPNRKRDSFLYNRTLHNMNTINTNLVNPSKARKILKTYQEEVDDTDHQVNKKSEFAREMLMFPLSIKNPDVPLMLGRSKKKTGPPKFDKRRFATGPEKYFSWESTPELYEAKRNLQELKKSAGSQQGVLGSVKNALDQVINLFPYIGDGYYEQPAVQYDNKYGPYDPRTERGKEYYYGNTGGSSSNEKISQPPIHRVVAPSSVRNNKVLTSSSR